MNIFKRTKVSDYSSLFRGMMSHSDRLRIIDNGENSSLLINGVEVRGSRQVLERVRTGLIRNGGPQRLRIS